LPHRDRNAECNKLSAAPTRLGLDKRPDAEMSQTGYGYERPASAPPPGSAKVRHGALAPRPFQSTQRRGLCLRQDAQDKAPRPFRAKIQKPAFRFTLRK